MKFRFTMGLMFVSLCMSATMARADFEYFSGNADDLGKLVHTSKKPVAVFYTGPWIKESDKSMERNLRQYIEPDFAGKVRFVYVDLEKNKDTLEARPPHPFMEIYQMHKDSRDNSTIEANRISVIEAGSEVPTMRRDLKIAMTPTLDMSEEPLVLSIRKQRGELSGKIFDIQRSLDLQLCFQAQHERRANMLDEITSFENEARQRLASSKELAEKAALGIKKSYEKLAGKFKKYVTLSDFTLLVENFRDNDSDRNTLKNLYKLIEKKFPKEQDHQQFYYEIENAFESNTDLAASKQLARGARDLSLETSLTNRLKYTDWSKVNYLYTYDNGVRGYIPCSEILAKNQAELEAEKKVSSAGVQDGVTKTVEANQTANASLASQIESQAAAAK